MRPSRPSRPVDGRVSFLPMEAVSEDGRIANAQVCDYSEVCTGYTSFSNGDILVAKITPCFENGKGALVTDLVNGIGFGSTEFHVLRPDRGANTRLLAHVVGSSEFRVRGTSEMVGSAGHKRVSENFIESFRFAEPTSIEEQTTIVSMLDAADGLKLRLRTNLNVLIFQRNTLASQLTSGGRRFEPFAAQASVAEL